MGDPGPQTVVFLLPLRHAGNPASEHMGRTVKRRMAKNVLRQSLSKKKRKKKTTLRLACVFPYNMGRYLDVYVTQMSLAYQLQGQDFLLILK